MSFRVRLTLLVALAIAATVSAASVAVWVVSKHELLTQFDQKLYAQATSGHGPSPFDRNTFTTFIQTNGTARGMVPATPRALRLAANKNGSAYFTDANVVDTTGTSFHLRELIAPTFNEEGTRTGAVIVAQSLESTDHALARIRFWILLVGGIGIALAAALAAFVATAALRPVRRLTAAAETVAAIANATSTVSRTRKLMALRAARIRRRERCAAAAARRSLPASAAGSRCRPTVRSTSRRSHSPRRARRSVSG